MSEPMIEVEGLTKAFGDVQALAGLDLRVQRGELLGLLGPNGAGKTTLINVVTTLLRPDTGMCRVAGLDVVSRPDAVRGVIGVTGQFAALDDNLTGRENLVMFARLLKLSKAAARTRAGELLEQFDLTHAGDRRVGKYSGGMRRRLDLAVSMINRPAVLFLDEPTTGLDPRSRQSLWGVVQALKDAGVTILLTTQYLEEADQLADRIVVIDHGRVIDDGTPAELKDQVGGTLVVLTIVDANRRDRAATALVGTGEVKVAGDVITVGATDGVAAVAAVVRSLDGAGIVPDDIELRRPSLDDVFFAVTGHAATPSDDDLEDLDDLDELDDLEDLDDDPDGAPAEAGRG